MEADKGPAQQDGQPDVTPPAQPEDPWAEAEKEFEKEPPKEEPKEPPKEDPKPKDAEEEDKEPAAKGDGQPEKEPDKPEGDELEDAGEEGNWYSVDDVPGLEGATPEQKKAYQKHLRKVQGKERKRYQEAVENGKAYEGYWQNQIAMFAQVAKAPPEQRGAVVEELLKQNIPVLKKLGIEVYESKPAEMTIPPELDDLTKRIAKAETPEEAADLMAKRDQIMFAHFSKVTTEAIKKVREEGAKAAKDVVTPIEKETARFQKASEWNAAMDALRKGDKNNQPIENLDEVIPKIFEFIQSDPATQYAIRALNSDPEGSAKRGLTRASILRRVHGLITEPDRIKAASKKAEEELRKQISESGEPPSKHIQTDKGEGLDWDELEKDFHANA